MKKLLMVLAMLIGIAGYGFAKDIYAHDASVLPKAAQSIIAKNFKAKVSVVKMDKDFGRVTEYEAILAVSTAMETGTTLKSTNQNLFRRLLFPRGYATSLQNSNPVNASWASTRNAVDMMLN